MESELGLEAVAVGAWAMPDEEEETAEDEAIGED